MALGEFISPGYDCTDILNKKSNTKDGFYWIHLNGKTPQKVRNNCMIQQEPALFGYVILMAR